MKPFQRVVAFVLLMCMVVGLVPAGMLEPVAYAEAPDASTVVASEFSSYSEEAARLARQGETRSESGWQ